MSGVIHAAEDGGPLTAGQVFGCLADVGTINLASMPIRATTPHGSYVFDVVEVELSGGVATLRLRERPPE